MAALNPRRARILMGGLIAAGVVFTVLVLALDADGPRGFPAGVRLPAATAEGAPWSPDGGWVAIPSPTGVVLRSKNASLRLRAPRTPRFRGQLPGRIGWSRDGSELRYVTRIGPEKGKGAWVTTVPVEGGEVRQIPLGMNAQRVAWSRHGWRLVFTTGPYASGPDGPVGPQPALWALETPGSKPHELADLSGREGAPVFSPDGGRILLSLRGRNDQEELWTLRGDGSRARSLAGPFLDAHYSWSPDGHWIAIAGSRPVGDRRNHLYLLSAGGGTLRQIGDTEVAPSAPTWTPGGRWIAYATADGRIEKVRRDGSETKRIAEFPGEAVGNLLYSPDGRQLAYSREAVDEGD